MFSGKTIFISVLDWGLGHATRTAPIIQKLLLNNKIILGVTSENQFFFKENFPDLLQVKVPSYKIKYSKSLPAWTKILLQWPRLFSVISKEKRMVDQLIKEYDVDVLMSDNRYGFYSDKIHSVIITHQLKIKSPFFHSLANNVNTRLLRRFNEICVPDFEQREQRLSGELSNEENIKNVKFIGPQSFLPYVENANPKYDYLILLSGPEPQRTILENKLIRNFRNSTAKVVLVRGKKGNMPVSNIETFDLVFGKQLSELIADAETVICRSGYSTLMDLHLLNKKKIIVIPTPGQPEQEYLARHWEQRFGAIRLSQKKVSTFHF